MVKQLEKTSRRIDEINAKIKTSFSLIRQDLDEMMRTQEAMKIFINKQDKQNKYARKEDNRIREEFRKDVDEFTQKISQLKLALSAVRDLQAELLTRKDLAQIEDRIRTSFKNEIESYKESVKSLKQELKENQKRLSHLESGKVFEKKKGWFFKRKEN